MSPQQEAALNRIAQLETQIAANPDDWGTIEDVKRIVGLTSDDSIRKLVESGRIVMRVCGPKKGATRYDLNTARLDVIEEIRETNDLAPPPPLDGRRAALAEERTGIAERRKAKKPPTEPTQPGPAT